MWPLWTYVIRGMSLLLLSSGQLLRVDKNSQTSRDPLHQLSCHPVHDILRSMRETSLLCFKKTKLKTVGVSCLTTHTKPHASSRAAGSISGAAVGAHSLDFRTVSCIFNGFHPVLAAARERSRTHLEILFGISQRRAAL